MDGAKFDRLSRVLAVGSTRRQALRGLIGGVFGLAAVRQAAAQNDCAAFCRSVPPGRQRGECMADCGQGGGLFVACGGDADRLCQHPDGAYTCCGAEQTCQAGACVDPVCAPPSCCCHCTGVRWEFRQDGDSGDWEEAEGDAPYACTTNFPFSPGCEDPNGSACGDNEIACEVFCRDKYNELMLPPGWSPVGDDLHEWTLVCSAGGGGAYACGEDAQCHFTTC